MPETVASGAFRNAERTLRDPSGCELEGRAKPHERSLGDTPPAHRPGPHSGPGWLGYDTGRSLSPYEATGFLPDRPVLAAACVCVDCRRRRVGPARCFFRAGRFWAGAAAAMVRCDCSCECTAATVWPSGRTAATTDDPPAIVPADVLRLPPARYTRRRPLSFCF